MMHRHAQKIRSGAAATELAILLPFLLLLFGVILVLVLAPLQAGPGGCGAPIGNMIPWFSDTPPRECLDNLAQRTTQLVVLGLLAIPLAVSTAINRSHE